MHAGSIRHGFTKAGRLYRELMRTPGEWRDALELDEAIGRSTALSTRVSEVRKQLPDGLELEYQRENGRGYYRIVRVAAKGEQMMLGGVA